VNALDGVEARHDDAYPHARRFPRGFVRGLAAAWARATSYLCQLVAAVCWPCSRRASLTRQETTGR